MAEQHVDIEDEEVLEEIVPEVEQDDAPETTETASDEPSTPPAALPSPLLSLYTKMLLGAIAATIASLCFLIYFRTVQCSFGFILAAYLIYLAISLKKDYDNGKITEETVICSSVTTMAARSSTRVVFRSIIEKEEDVPQYYEFYLPGRENANKDFIPTYVYVIYFRPSDARKLLGYFQM